MAAVSDRSTANNIILWGFCENGAKFYLSEEEVKANIKVESTKDKLEKISLKLSNTCDEIVKSKLNYPATFKKSFLRSGVSVEEYTAKVLVGFSAKNSLGVEIEQEAVCIFNDKSELVSFSMK